MMAIPNKAVAAGGTTTIAGAAAALVILLWWPNADASAAVALTTLFQGIGAYAAAWLAKFEGGPTP